MKKKKKLLSRKKQNPMNLLKKNSRVTVWTARIGLTAAVLLLLPVGCQDTGNADVRAARDRLVVKTPADGATTVSKIRKQLNGDDAVTEVPVVIRGRINAGDLPPWETGVAAFALTDASGHDGDDDHDPWACPFCSRSIEDYIVNVYFHSEDGTVIPIDSRELFGVTEKQLVVVQGIGMMGDDGTLIVHASNIYIQP